jgi:hypothetical protein
MTKTLLSILIALVFVFGAAGVTVAAAQKSLPGEPLFALRTWSTQMLHQQDKMQISGRVEQKIQTQSRIHELEITQTPQNPTPLEVCDQLGTNGQCGADQDPGANHANDHPHRDHGNDGINHGNDGANHENNGSEYEENEH